MEVVVYLNDLVKFYGHITRDGKTSQIPIKNDWAFVKFLMEESLNKLEQECWR